METPLRFEFPVDIKHVRRIRANRKRAMQSQSRLCQSLILAYQINNMFHARDLQGFQQVSQWFGFSPARLSQILNLLLLSPQIQEAILFSKEMTLTESLARKIALLPDWEEQAMAWKDTFRE